MVLKGKNNLVFGVFILLCFVVLLNNVSAKEDILLEDSIQVFEQHKPANIRMVCESEVDGGVCDSNTICNMTLFYPNGSSFLSSKTMTFNTQYYNYTLSSAQTSLTGEYKLIASCKSAIGSGVIPEARIVITKDGSTSGLASENWKIALIIILVVMSGVFALVGTATNSEKGLIKSALYMTSLLSILIAVNMGIQFAVGDQTSKLMTTALVIGVSAFAIFLLYIFVSYMIQIFKALKQSKEENKANGF